jgi:hypothetical protein
MLTGFVPLPLANAATSRVHAYFDVWFTASNFCIIWLYSCYVSDSKVYNYLIVSMFAPVVSYWFYMYSSNRGEVKEARLTHFVRGVNAIVAHSPGRPEDPTTCPPRHDQHLSARRTLLRVELEHLRHGSWGQLHALAWRRVPHPRWPSELGRISPGHTPRRGKGGWRMAGGGCGGPI